MPLVLLASKYFYIISLPNLLTLRVPDEGYSKIVSVLILIYQYQIYMIQCLVIFNFVLRARLAQEVR